MDAIVSTGFATQSSERAETLASSVYQQVLKDILSGQLEPGRKLHLQKMKTRYAVGNSPLREALNRLSANGMVVREENKGFRVCPASADELLDLIKTRCLLEEIALRESIKNGSREWDTRVVLAFHRLSKITQPDSGNPLTSPELASAHREFHLAMISACGSKILQGYCEQLQERTLRYRNLTEVVAYRERHELEEHRAIYEAAIDRDADKAIELMHAHFKITAEIVLASGSLT